ncbi:MAG: hypothetical protein JWR38_804 [Mucilaginibacter sp.]|nr:hypothetical protein [Mucilaginibacter sp.]
MKKFILLTIGLATVFAGCKKSKDVGPQPEKDYGAVIKDKTWTGEFTYAGQPKGYYSVQFNADNTSVWSEAGGNYTGGTWALNGKQLSIIQTAFIQSKGDISDDNQLINISNTSASLTLNSGQLNTNANMVLDNTLWKGTIADATNVLTPISFAFASGLKLTVTSSAGVIIKVYERGGASVRFKDPGVTSFGVITPDGKQIRGVSSNHAQWQLTKQ